MKYVSLMSGATLAAVTVVGCNTNPDPVVDVNVNPPVVSSSSSVDMMGVEVGGALMVPSNDIVENASRADNVTTLVAAVQAADLEATLKSNGPFTVFAPTNSAFDALPAGTVDTLLLPENKAMLQNILTYHVVPGSYTAADLRGGMTLTSVQGEALNIKYEGGVWTVNDAEILIPDVISSNGVTFVIDGVLLPTETDAAIDGNVDVMDDSDDIDDENIMNN